MSKKIEAIKKAVFYAHEKPEKLAEIIAGLVDDVATSIEISGADSIQILASGDAKSTYTASVLSQFGDAMTGTVSFALDTAVTGVSVDATSGEVTVADSTTATSFTLKVTSGSLTATKVVSLVAAE